MNSSWATTSGSSLPAAYNACGNQLEIKDCSRGGIKADGAPLGFH